MCVSGEDRVTEYRLTLKDLSIHGYIITLSMTIRANSVLYDPTPIQLIHEFR